MQDPEVNDLSIDAENYAVSAEVRIARNSSCCNNEMKEYTFNTEEHLDDDLIKKVEAALKEAGEDAEVEVKEAGLDSLEEGGSRYKKSYYGFTLTASIKVAGKEIGTVELTDKIEASGMDELT
jgi:hypothetical protein